MDTPSALCNVPLSTESARCDTQSILNHSELMLNDARLKMLDTAIETVRFANEVVMQHVQDGQNDVSQARSAFRLAARAFLNIDQNGAMQIIDEIGKDFGKDVSLYKRDHIAAKIAIEELAFQLHDTGVSDDFPEDWDEETIAFYKRLIADEEEDQAHTELISECSSDSPELNAFQEALLRDLLLPEDESDDETTLETPDVDDLVSMVEDLLRDDNVVSTAGPQRGDSRVAYLVDPHRFQRHVPDTGIFKACVTGSSTSPAYFVQTYPAHGAYAAPRG